MNENVLNSLPEKPRLAVEQIRRSFTNMGGLAGMFITGSYARGFVPPDDLDLIAIWDQPVSDTRRREIVTRCRAGRSGDPDTDHFRLHGVVPEFHFMAGKDQVRQMIANFCWNAELPPESDEDRAEGLLASLADAVPVFDPEGLAAQWQRMLAEEYPREYQARRVYAQYSAACRRMAHLERCAVRNDPLYELKARIEFIEHLVRGTVSLNRRFYWGSKWSAQQVERLETKPDRAWERICGILRNGYAAARIEMKSLALDTGDLVQASLPEVDVAFSMSVLRQIR